MVTPQNNQTPVTLHCIRISCSYYFRLHKLLLHRNFTKTNTQSKVDLKLLAPVIIQAN